MDATFPTIACCGMGTPPPNGHQVIAVWCNRCGHQAKVSPEVWAKTKRRHCRMCGSRDYSHRWIWIGGKLPDNVVPITRGRRDRT